MQSQVKVLCQLAAILFLSIAAATPLSSHPAQSTPTLQQIPGTNLTIKMPSDWKLEKAPGEWPSGGYSLQHIGKPESTLSLLQSGDAMVAVQIQLRSNGSPRPDIVTPMLAAIAEAAISQSKVIFSPGRVKLPLLGIEVPVRTGAWGVMTSPDGFGTSDVLGRAASSRSNELLVTPFFSRDPGTCISLMANSPAAAVPGATLIRDRKYGSAPWHPDAWEMFPPPFRALEAFVCRDVGQKSKLLVRIEYESRKSRPTTPRSCANCSTT